MGGSVRDRALALRGALAAHPELARDPSMVVALRQLEELLEADPLQSFVPNAAQVPWYEADTRIVAAFAGNRFGKTTSLVVRALIECVDRDSLPRALQPYKRWDKTNAPRGTHVRIVCPSFSLLDANIVEQFRRWAPANQLLGGAFDKAYKGPPTRRLSFKNGSFVEFMVYEQDLDKFGGTARHVVGYDEPPPEDIRQECLFRTVDYGGYEMFAVTPLKVNTGWLRREIFKKRESPDITVIQGSIHDNPLLDEAAKTAALGSANDLWRQAREFGTFVDMGGLVYPEIGQCVIDPPSIAFIRSLDIVVGIDPGLRNCGIGFFGFDSDNTLWMFDEAMLQDKTPSAYVEKIDERLKFWGIPRDRVEFVVDPAQAQRSQATGESVGDELARLGVFGVPAQNNHEAGAQQLRERMIGRPSGRRFFVSRNCRIAIDQLEEVAAEERADNVFKLVRGNDHVADLPRYVAMHRPFFPEEEAAEPDRQLGFRPDAAPPEHLLQRAPAQAPPMGALS